MGLPRKSRHNVCCFSRSQSVIGDMLTFPRVAALTQEGGAARAILVDKHYEFAVCKNPKVGLKLPHLVPFFTNYWHWEGVSKDWRWNPLRSVLACYPNSSCAVDGGYQMTLQMRQLGRQRTLTHAVRAFMVQYAARNAFATARALGLVDDKTTMWDFQSDIFKRRYFGGAEFNDAEQTAVVPRLHAPKQFASGLLCTHSPQRDYTFGVRRLREAHAHQVLLRCP